MAYLYIQLLLIIIVLITHIQCQFPIINLTKREFNQEDIFTTDICIGTPNSQCFSIELTFSSFLLVVSKSQQEEQLSFVAKLFNPQLSSTYQENPEDIFKFPIYVIERENSIDLTKEIMIIAKGSEDTISISNFKIQELKFTLTNQDPISMVVNGIIGLGYKPKEHEREYSLIEQLYNKKLISNRVFTLEYNKDEDVHRLSFGNIPKIVISDNKHYARCNLLQIDPLLKIIPNPYWECMVKKISLPLSNTLIQTDIPIVFSLNTTNTYMPYALLGIFKKEFSSLFEKDKCRIITFDMGVIIECRFNTYIPKMRMSFDEWELTLTYENLSNEKFKNIVYIFKKGMKHIILGRKILDQFILVFEKENEIMGIYNTFLIKYLGSGEPKEIPLGSKGETFEFDKGDKGVNSKYDNMRGRIKGTLWIFGISCFITVAIFGMMIRYRHKEKKKFEMFDQLYYNNDNNSELTEVNTKNDSSNGLTIN